MAEDTQFDELSWSQFVDRLAGPLRLERADRQAYGVLATVHLAGAIWGDIALFRAAARLAILHHFDVERLCAEGESPALRRWYAGFLARHAGSARDAGETGPLPQDLLKPAWRTDGIHR